MEKWMTGKQVRVLRWLGEVPMGYRSAIRVPPNDQEVRGTLGLSTSLRDGAQVVIRPRTDILGWREHRQWTHPIGRDIRSIHHGPGQCCHWDATNKQEDRENRAANRPARWRRRRPFTSLDFSGLVKASSIIAQGHRGPWREGEC